MGKFKTFEDMKHNIPEGATHYQDESEEFMFAWFNANEDKCYVMGEWKYCSMKDYPDGEIKPIPQKPRTRTEYNKVKESIWELRGEFERGELYRLRKDDIDGYVKVTDLKVLVEEIKGCGIFRLVEKEIDWREESHGYLADKTGFHWSTPIAEVINDESDCFLELCRVALRANGEIE